MLAVSPALFLTSRPIFPGPGASSVHRGAKATGAHETGAQPGTRPLLSEAVTLLPLHVAAGDDCSHPGRALCS